MTQDKFYFNNPKSSLLNYSENEILNIIEDYIVNDFSKTEIALKYPKIKESSSFTKDFPYLLSDEKCPNCDSEIHIKSHKIGGKSSNFKLCRNCNHSFESNCSCNQCKLKQEEEKQKNIEKFNSNWHEELGYLFDVKSSLETLSIEDETKLYWIFSEFYDFENKYLDFTKLNKDEELYLNSLGETSKPNILEQLISRKLLAPLCVYNSEIHLQNVQYFFRVSPKLFKWNINISYKGNQLNYEEFIQYKMDQEYDDKTILNFWSLIYQQEIEGYILHNSNRIQNYVLDEYTSEFISDVLIEYFSLSKAFAIIYSAIGATSKYIILCKENSKNANEYFRKKITESALKYKDAKFFKDYERPASIQLSGLNNFIIQHILGIKIHYFYINFEIILLNYKQLK